MASSGRNRSFNEGYRGWFQPFRYNQTENLPIFILDYEPSSKQEEVEADYINYEDASNYRGKTVTINGIWIFFLDDKHVKRKVFLRHEPYFYLLLQDNLPSNHINRMIAQLYDLGENKVVSVTKTVCHDAEDLTFLAEKDFLRVTVDHPGSVPGLRSKFESISGVVEWREADVLYHHRVAIDHNVRVGYWYQAKIRSGEIQELTFIENKAPPELKVLAYDIETVFDQTREPNPNRDAISMISLFTGEMNFLLVNDEVVETKDITEIDIILRKEDKDHPKPWVDYCKQGAVFPPSDIIDRIPVDIKIYNTEKDLLYTFYKIIEDFKPDVIADFFGDKFDVPFLAVRSQIYNISLEERTGFQIEFKFELTRNANGKLDLRENFSPAKIDYVAGGGVIHLDAYLFNEKYSYLPKKDLGLKPSVEKKLKIIPIGREALFAIEENPSDAVGYACCDGYITLRYVKEIVLDFFISMGQMFPVPSSELLTRRAGSLDDLLIDAENHKYNIVGRRRIRQKHIKTFSPKLIIDSFAYTGGLVEARQTGIFRSDIHNEFTVDKKALTEIKEIVRKIIAKTSKNIAKKEMKAEFERKILTEFDDLSLTYTEDPDQLLQDFNTIMKQNGVPTHDLEEKNRLFRTLLESISQIKVDGLEEVIEETMNKIDDLIQNTNPVQMQGVHVDVTSMYPSQIRQYKLQPSGIVPISKCAKCEYAESDGSCYFEGDWVIKLTGRRPCRHRQSGSPECITCTAENESKCQKYEPEQSTSGRVQEVYTFQKGITEVYAFRKKAGLVKIPLNKSYLGEGTSSGEFFDQIKKWLDNVVEATQVTCRLNKNYFDIFENQPDNFDLPENTFLSIDVRTKKISLLVSVQSRVCQKSFNFVSRIMDDFYNTRVKHKFEAQRLKQVIRQKITSNQNVPPEMYRQQKFHDSTQLGMKVPLNSIYGLLGMKAGVRNASTPCAGITTKLSADLIHWAADQLEKIGTVTELDTDGVWLWVPRQFPLFFRINLVNPSNPEDSREIKETIIDKILNEKVKSAGFRNDNYYMNDGSEISKISKSLIEFEQDSPYGYDFMFVMGKKKYIVYNHHSKDNSWEEKELTGLESKRADFSKLQKYFQEEVIKSYLEDFSLENPITLSEIYQNAIKASERIREEVTKGKLDHTYFIKPKAINKELHEYKSKLPQVKAAYILQDLGYTVDPGTRIQMVNIKGDTVIPAQVFDFDFETVKSVFIKHGISTLSFMLNELTSIDDIRGLIDTKQYLQDIYGPGRIFERMVHFPMEKQQVRKSSQPTLEIDGVKTQQISKSEAIDITKKESYEPKLSPKSHQIIEKAPPRKVEIVKQRISNKKGNSVKKGKKKLRTQSLDTIFSFPQPKKSSKKSKTKKSRLQKKKLVQTKEKQVIHDLKEEISPLQDESSKEELKQISSDLIISTDEIEELETAKMYNNGQKKEETLDFPQNEHQSDEIVVCSQCGAFISLDECLDDGCIHCNDRSLSGL